MSDKPPEQTTIQPIEPIDFCLETVGRSDGSLSVSLSAICTRVEHAIYLHKAAAVIERLCLIAPPATEIDGDWAE